MIIRKLLLLFLIAHSDVSFCTISEDDYHPYSYYYKKELLESSFLPVLLVSLGIDSTAEVNTLLKEMKKSELGYFITVSTAQYGANEKLIQAIRLYAELRMQGFDSKELLEALTEPGEWKTELSLFEKGSLFPAELGIRSDIRKKITDIKQKFPFIPLKRLSFNLYPVNNNTKKSDYHFFELRLPRENERQENYRLFCYSSKGNNLVSIRGFYYGIIIIEGITGRTVIIDSTAGQTKTIDPKNKNIVLPNRMKRRLNDIDASGIQI